MTRFHGILANLLYNIHPDRQKQLHSLFSMLIDTMGVINIAILNEILTALPSLYEQGEVVDYINEQKVNFSTLIYHAKKCCVPVE